MRSKRGGIGDFISMIISIIVIAFILGGFVLISGLWIAFAEEPAGAVSYGSDGSEGDFFVYMNESYPVFVEDKFLTKKEVGFG